jgi:hypothetical protein
MGLGWTARGWVTVILELILVMSVLKSNRFLNFSKPLLCFIIVFYCHVFQI